jgi:hypothetical protein
MSNIELQELREELRRSAEKIKELEKRLEKEEATPPTQKPSYSFSSISETKLETLLEVKRILRVGSKFDKWFKNGIEISTEDSLFFKQLLERQQVKIDVYNEQTLSMKFISSILNRVNFDIYEEEISDFYEYNISYEFEKFIFTGEPDFFVAKGEIKPEKPLFFIQEFKKTKDPKYPEPQLIAELITAIEINGWNEIKGAFIIGANWHFVVLEKIENRYQYYVSDEFNSKEIEKLIAIYRNLLFVKNEIIEMVDSQ